MTLVLVLEYVYKGIVVEGRSGDESLVGCICNQADEVVYCLVDLFRREVQGWGAREGVELVELESTLFLVTPPSEELMRARNLERTLSIR